MNIEEKRAERKLKRMMQKLDEQLKPIHKSLKPVDPDACNPVEPIA